MEINWNKTTELVFQRPNRQSGINTRASVEARLLGVIVSGKFAFHAHIKYQIPTVSSFTTVVFTQAPTSAGITTA